MNHDGTHKVVISGISGRFPNSNNIIEFQNNLLNNVECTTTEHGRWDFDTPKVPQRMGAINNLGKFDRVFFGVHSRLTAIMDPGSRLLLEHCFEAIMDAGINPRSLKGANIAVFTATHLSESEKTVFHNKVQQDGFGIMGCSKAMIPNRVSFFLGLNGSSINIDSACTGSGTALECAYHHIKEGRCDGAIVAGSMLALHPHISYQLRALGLLSPDGVTRSFDDSANGHTRSESVSVLFLQRAIDAKRIYQEVVNVKTTHADSRENNTIMYPNIECQVSVMKDLLKESSLTPDDIAYLEASGVALKHADADELCAIDIVYGKRKKSLPIGSIKSIIGNAVSANTINSIIKMIISSETGQIPPNVNYESPNSEVSCIKEGRVTIPTELSPWIGEYSSVNTTSICGVFSNVLLKDPKIEKKNYGIPDDDLPRLVIASGRTEKAVENFLDYMESRPLDGDYLQLLYDIFESEIDAHLFRGYTVIPAKGLPSLNSNKREILFKPGDSKEIWWVFSGMGSQWAGMGNSLLRLPIFEAAIRKCDAVLNPFGYDIFKIITAKDSRTFDLIVNSFLGIAAIQIGLVDVLKAVGLEPDFIIGHSVGELGCAYADGCFSAEQMIMAALSRGLASVETELVKGSMAAVGLGYEDIKLLCPSDIDVACHNGPESTTISGPAESLKDFVESLSARGIFAREVASSNIAYHSRYIAPAGPKLLERLQKVIPKPNPRSSKWVSTSVPRHEWNTLKARLCSAEYHTNNLLSPVLFEETSRLIPSNAICIEIAPHGLLQAILKRSLPESCINIPLTRRGHPDNLELLLTALGKIYNVGLQPKISNLYPKAQFPVGKGTPSISSLVKWDHSQDWLVNYYTPIEEVKEGERRFEINLNDEKFKYLRGNVINGKITLPLSLCLMYVKDILKDFNQEEENFIFEDIQVHKLLLQVPSDNIFVITLMVPKGTGKFEIVESETLVLSGTVKTFKTPLQEKFQILSNNLEKYELNQTEFYTELQMRGYQYSGYFRNVLQSSVDGKCALIHWENWVTFIDSAFQLFIFGNDIRQVEVPLSIGKIIVNQQKQDSILKISEDVPAVVDKKLNYVCVGGLEIREIKLSTIPFTLEYNSLSNDDLRIIPNYENNNLPLVESIRVILQLILENTYFNKLRRIQLVQDDVLQALDSFKKSLKFIPEATLFKIESISYKDAKFDKSLTVVPHHSNCNLIDISQKLKSGKFVLVFWPNTLIDIIIKSVKELNLKIIFLRKNIGESVVLLRKKFVPRNIKLIYGSNNIDELINRIQISDTQENERVIIIKKSRDISDMVDFIGQLDKTLNLEKIRIFYINDTKVMDNFFDDPFYTDQLEQDLLINILSVSKTWGTLRHCEIDTQYKLSNVWVANFKNSYDFNNIIWTDGSKFKNVKSLIKVEFASLSIFEANRNFYSVPYKVTEKKRSAEKHLGFEFSGLDLKGNKVMGLTHDSSLTNLVDADTEWLWNVPQPWNLEDAVTVPLSYILAYLALFLKAEVKIGERVMLHNPCNAIGLALLQVAVSKKCDVFVTYETIAEKKLIESSCQGFPANRLFKLSGDNFRDQILKATQGTGVDVIISNQPQVKKLEVFFSMTKRNARVVLISNLQKNEIHDNIGMEIFLKEIVLYSIIPKKIFSLDAKTKKNIAILISDGLKTGLIKPLPKTVYKRDSLSEAFLDQISNKTKKKIVIKVQPEGEKISQAFVFPRFYCSSIKSYLIIEGRTLIGLELIDWLITRGARRFIVVSSSENNGAYKNYRSKIWKNYEVQISWKENINLLNKENIKSLFKEATMLGSVDAVFDLRRTDTLKTHFNSLLETTKLLDIESRICHELRLFVVCAAVENTKSFKILKKSAESQVTKNQEVEALIDDRRKDGLHGLYVKFGLLAPSEKESVEVFPPIRKYLEKLDQSLETNHKSIEIVHIVGPTHEVEDDTIDEDYNSLDPVIKDVKTFTAGLYEQYGVHVEGYSYLQV